MDITLSVATSRDHYIDDNTPQRLRLSTDKDWEAVHRLRAAHDAILVGGETLRRDNPTLGIKCEGRAPLRVVVSGRGEIDPASKIFYCGESEVVIFSHLPHPELSHVASVITSEVIDIPLIITELEKRGVERLFVEGGAKILSLFLSSGEVSTLRVATNPNIVVGDHSAPRFDLPVWVEKMSHERENLGGMEVTTYTLRPPQISEEDTAAMRRVVEISRRSPSRESCYRVGALLKCVDGSQFEGYTLETSPTHHAEQAAIHKAQQAGVEIKGATIYSSMEPCSKRSSEPMSCSELIIKYGLSRALFALYEPSHFVECHGAENLRRAGVCVTYMPQFRDDVVEVNAHLLLTK